MSPPRQVLRYPGSTTRLAPWIVAQMSPHTTYVEPFCGSCAVFVAKPPSRIEVLNDLDARVVTVFRVLRDRPDELARAAAQDHRVLAEAHHSDIASINPSHTSGSASALSSGIGDTARGQA